MVFGNKKGMKMKTKYILQTRCTVLQSVNGKQGNEWNTNSYTQVDMSVDTILHKLIPLYKDKLQEIASLPYHSDLQKAYKSQFPCWFVGGTFPQEKTNDVDILTYSNLLAIDLDAKDNTDIFELRDTIFNLPYVVAVLKSISGMGVYALVLVEDGKYTKDYYKYLANLWNKQYGLNIDLQCTNIGRKRFIAYDEEMDKWIKPNDVEIKPWRLKYREIPVEPVRSECRRYIEHNKDNMSLLELAITKLVDDGFCVSDIARSNPYGVWYHVACDFKHLSNGYELFERFSSNDPKYHDTQKDIATKYNNAKPTPTTIDELCHKYCGIAKQRIGVGWWK